MKPIAPALLLAAVTAACAPPGPSTGVAAAITPVLARCDTAHDLPVLMARGVSPDTVQIQRAMLVGARTCREVQSEVAALTLPAAVHEACDPIPALKADSLELMPLLKGATAAAAKPAVAAKIKAAKRAMVVCSRAVTRADPGAGAWVREAKARGELT